MISIKLRHLFLGLNLVVPFFLFSQNYTTKKTASPKALKSYNEGIQNNLQLQFEKALKSFGEALKIDANFIEAQIQEGALYYKLSMLSNAEIAFEKVEKLDPNFEPEVLFSLGNIEMKQDKGEEAAIHFEAYAKSAKSPVEKRNKAEKMAKDARFIAKAIKNPVPFNPQSLGDKVNTPQFSEYLPSMTADGETLIYTARVGRQEDFYVSKKVNGEWQKGEPLKELNTDENEGAQCISPDGRLLLYTACNRPEVQGGCDVFYSQKKEGKWTPAKGFPAIVTNAWESQPSISADGKIIYFSSDRAGGLGGRDIWYVVFANGKWSEARNMGKPINTPFDEQAPFIHLDGETFYFTSNGHAGMGGQDLYVARFQRDSTWSEPQNLGFPINTKADEATLSVSIDGKTAFYAKDVNTIINGKPNYDLYAFELPEAARAKPVTYAKAKVFDADTKAPLSSRVEIIDLATQKTLIVANTDENGEFLVCLPLGKNYALNVSKEKYLFQSENFNLTEKNTADKPFLLEINLQPIKAVVAEVLKPINTTPLKTTVVEKPLPEKAIILKNVFFDTDKADLRPESFSELNKLKLLLTENPTMRIELRGHTDSQGSDTHNLDLSSRRAKAVVTYLAKNGISADRLQSKGFGETSPIDSNDMEQGRQNNRRTEFVILK
jgi:outer membrane protein OmpA-like peptidoglycan-associated protein